MNHTNPDYQISLPNPSITFNNANREVLRITRDGRLVCGEGLSVNAATQEAAKLLIVSFEQEIKKMVDALAAAELAAMTARAEKAEAECLEQARLLGISGSEVAALKRPLFRLTNLWHQLFFLLDITEESDSGNEFRPNYISSCRAVDGDRIEKILTEAKQIINANVNNQHLW